MVSSPLLQIRDLTVRLRFSGAAVLNGVSFDLAAGESVGILGESGCGKTTLAKTLLQLLPPDNWLASGSVQFRQSELLAANDRQLRKIRGAQISLISQEPELALNPVLTVGRQIDEVLRAHSQMDRRSRRQEIEFLLSATGLPGSQIYSAYPHELSGGQRQRVAIAQSLIAKPSLLIADEPTSALDNLTQAETLALLRTLKDRLHVALLFITHNPALLSGLASRLIVMRGGAIVEDGGFEQLYWKPQHSYTEALMRVIPSQRISTMAAPNLPRTPLLEVQHLTKTYARARSPFRTQARVVALEDIQLTIPPQSTLALVGKSGAGKSTLARCVALLESPDSGAVRFQNQELFTLHGATLAAARRNIQLIFQHSATAMDPLFSALEVVAEPLRIQGTIHKQECQERALAMMNEVGISSDWAHRSSREFSGGQRQRIALARALILKPKLLVLDEALAGLDPGMQLQIADMLLRLQAFLSLSYLFISHDLRMAAYLSDAIAIIEHGKIVETGSVDDIFSHTERPATRELLNSIPAVLPSPI